MNIRSVGSLEVDPIRLIVVRVRVDTVDLVLVEGTWTFDDEPESTTQNVRRREGAIDGGVSTTTGDPEADLEDLVNGAAVGAIVERAMVAGDEKSVISRRLSEVRGMSPQHVVELVTIDGQVVGGARLAIGGLTILGVRWKTESVLIVHAGGSSVRMALQVASRVS